MSDEKKPAGEKDSEGAAERLSDAREKFTKAVSSAQKGARGLRKGAEHAGEKLKQKAEHAGEKLKERAEQASHVARERIDSARDSVRHGYDRVSKDLDQLGQDVNEYVRHNPGRSVAIALGIGFVLGLLLRPRRD
jgi:ElaB/YqjD/DUF883 family membrane-anchored ribosome-binding protein